MRGPKKKGEQEISTLPCAVNSSKSGCGNETRRKRISSVFSKIRFREREDGGDEESHTWRTAKARSSPQKGGILRAESNGENRAGPVTNIPSGRNRQAGRKLDVVENPLQSSGHLKHRRKRLSGKIRSTRLSMGVLRPPLQSIREKSLSSLSPRDYENLFGRTGRPHELGRSVSAHFQRRAAVAGRRDDNNFLSFDLGDATTTCNDSCPSQDEKLSIEEMFRTTSNSSISDAESISLKAFFQSLIALENEI